MSVAIAGVPSFSLRTILEGMRAVLGGGSPLPAVEVPEEFQPIFLFAAPILGATDERALTVQLERAVPGMLEVIRDMPDFELPDLDDARELPEPSEDDLIGRTLGLAVAKQMAATFRDSLFVGRGQQILFSQLYNPDTPVDRRKLLLRTFSVHPARLHEGHVIPGRLLISTNEQIKGTTAMCALLGACLQRRKPEPWLSKALADDWTNGVKESAWLVESLGVATNTVLAEPAVNMSELFREADEADAAFTRQFELDVREGRTGIPSED